MPFQIGRIGGAPQVEKTEDRTQIFGFMVDGVVESACEITILISYRKCLSWLFVSVMEIIKYRKDDVSYRDFLLIWLQDAENSDLGCITFQISTLAVVFRNANSKSDNKYDISLYMHDRYLIYTHTHTFPNRLLMALPE